MPAISADSWDSTTYSVGEIHNGNLTISFAVPYKNGGDARNLVGH